MDAAPIKEITTILVRIAGWKGGFKIERKNFGVNSTNSKEELFFGIKLIRRKKNPNKTKSVAHKARDQKRLMQFRQKKQQDSTATDVSNSPSLTQIHPPPREPESRVNTVELKDDTPTTSSVISLTSPTTSSNQKYTSSTDTSLGTVRRESPEMEIETGEWKSVSNRRGNNKRKSVQSSRPVKRNIRSATAVRSQPVGRLIGGKPTDTKAGIKSGKSRSTLYSRDSYTQAYYNVLKDKCLQASGLNCLTTSADNDCMLAANVMSSSMTPVRPGASTHERVRRATEAFERLQGNKLMKDGFLLTLELKADDIQFLK